MKVKDRLQHGFSISVSIVVVLALVPVTATGQIITATEPYETVDASQQSIESLPASAQPGATASPEPDLLFLRARQSIAVGDIAGAEKFLAMLPTQVQGQHAETRSTVQALIEQQRTLAQLAAERRPDYNEKAAAFLLSQANSLLKLKDFESVEMLIGQARTFPVNFQSMSLTLTPDSLSAALEDAMRGNPSAGPLQDTLNLMSRAQFAFDKGDLDLARSLTLQAKQYGIPDAQLPANQIRPWQLDLKIQEAMQSNGNVVPASFENTASDKVVHADYYPETDTTRNIHVAATSSAGVDPAVLPGSPAFNPIPSKAMQLYEAGVKAVAANETAAAREYFQLAWQERSQLDETTQQSIQDQLNSLVEPSSPQESDVDELPNPDSIAATETTGASNNVKRDMATDSEQEQLFRRLQSEFLRQRALAERTREENPRRAIEMLTQMRNKITQSEISEESKRPLLKFIDRDITEFQQYIQSNLSDIQLQEDNAARLEEVHESRDQRYNTELQIQKLVEEFNDLMDEQRYAEANVVAQQAAELAPDHEIVALLKERAAIQINLARGEAVQDRKEAGFLESLNHVDEDSIQDVYEDFPLRYGDTDEYSRRAKLRAAWLSDQQYNSPEERRIWNILRNETVQGHFQGTLQDVVRELDDQTGVNIYIDAPALNAASISADNTVDVPFNQPISLESALNLILSSHGLVFVVEDEVVKVTSRDAQRRDVKPVTYYVGDLVTPIQNFTNSLSMNFLTPYGQVGNNGFLGQGNSVPLANNNTGNVSPVNLAASSIAASDPNSALAQQFGGIGRGGLNRPLLGGGPPQSGVPTYTSTGPQSPGGVSEADFFPLINLIRNTIDPDGWDDTNGDGTLQAFVPNLSLIVSQTQQAQDQIQDLLNQLRELNDVQIVVEVRFVSLADNFFERIGIDFDFRLNDYSGLNPAAITDETNPSATVGLTNSDANPTFTPDLDISFSQGSFSSTQPFFGGFDPMSAASFGFAILSDIEVFFLINAAKGDQRTNITQAPTVTMFNGQVASVSDGAQVPFVTSVTPVVGDFAVAQQPIITLLPEGASLNVQATVSHDRKSVRMTLVPFFSQITDVKTFTFDGSTTTQRATDENFIDDLIGNVTGTGGVETPTEVETTTQGVTVQLPTLGFTTVSTVVSVPDGGTILIGGVKRQTEQRVERGVPFLSNIPYVSRLFKNVGIGRETSSLMMMVTPRIIIQEEEEEDQVGTIN